MTTQTLPDSRVINFGYDAKGNVTSITPPGRPAHEFVYTANDQMSRYLPPNSQQPNSVTTYSYYLDGQLARITRPDGQAINLTYDPESGNPIVATLPTGQITYVYNGASGNLELVGAPDASVSYTYDGSLLKSETWSGGVVGSVSRTYDSSFRLGTQSINGSNAVTFSYDTDDLLTGAGALTLSRDATNGLVSGTALGSVTDTVGYNAFGEPTSYTATVSGSPIFGVSYTRDVLGRISSKTETIDGATTTFAYTYDAAGRLMDVLTNGTPTAHYDYDANSNRVGGYNTLCGDLAGTYDNQDRLLTANCPLPTAYAYTANGELLTKTDSGGTTTYTYDVVGNLRTAVLPNGTQLDYVVDGRNRRIGKRVNGTLVQALLYDGQLRIVAELDGSGVVVSRFVYGTKVNVPEYMIRGGVTYRIITDHLGSPRLVIDGATGAIAQRIDYDEFGNVLSDSNLGFQPFGFAGGLYDPETKLVRFGARDYDAETGRWTAKDPIGFGGRWPNLYGYTLQDPINHFDPTGLFSLSEQMTAANLAGALMNGATSALSTALDGGGRGEALKAFGIGAAGSLVYGTLAGTIAKEVAQAGVPKLFVYLFAGAFEGVAENIATTLTVCPDRGLDAASLIDSAFSQAIGAPGGAGKAKHAIVGQALSAALGLPVQLALADPSGGPCRP